MRKFKLLGPAFCLQEVKLFLARSTRDAGGHLNARAVPAVV